MPTHTVKQGDTLLSIAAENGFSSWETIWMDPQNQALREKRKDPQVLADGDSVFIPEKKTRIVHLETDKKHTFVVPRVKAWFRVTLRDNEGRLVANRRFNLDVAGKVKTGTTDASGKIELEVDPKPAEGTLKVFLDDADPSKNITWKVKLGHLDPLDKLSGVKARLTNLGFACGTIDDAMNEETKTALRNFQIVYRLPVTGEADQPTKDKLLVVHDNR